MGIILAPGLLFHLGLFALGIVLLAMKTKSFVSFFAYSPISLICSLLSGYWLLTYLFNLNSNSRIWAFDILIQITYGKYLIAVLLFIALAIFVYKKFSPIFLSAVCLSSFMVPFATVVLYFMFAKDLYKKFNILIHY